MWNILKIQFNVIHNALPPRFFWASGFSLVVLLLLNSGPLKSSLSSLSTGSGCTTIVPKKIIVKKYNKIYEIRTPTFKFNHVFIQLLGPED